MKTKEKSKEKSKIVKVVRGAARHPQADKETVDAPLIKQAKTVATKPVVKPNSLREVSSDKAPRLQGDVHYWGPTGESMDNPIFDNGEVRGDQSADAYYNIDKLNERFKED